MEYEAGSYETTQEPRQGLTHVDTQYLKVHHYYANPYSNEIASPRAFLQLKTLLTLLTLTLLILTSLFTHFLVS